MLKRIWVGGRGGRAGEGCVHVELSMFKLGGMRV